MKLLNEFILEKLVINNKPIEDKWVLINAPAFSNYSASERDKFEEEFINDGVSRLFEMESRDNITGGIWMNMMLIKISEIQKLMNIFNSKKYPIQFELPENLSIDASDKEINEFIKKHDHKGDWNYKELKKI